MNAGNLIMENNKTEHIELPDMQSLITTSFVFMGGRIFIEPAGNFRDPPGKEYLLEKLNYFMKDHPALMNLIPVLDSEKLSGTEANAQVQRAGLPRSDVTTC